MAETSPPQRKYRLLLDQGFPKPPGFALNALDNTAEAIHLSDFDRTISENSTPDWMVYCIAAENGFDALVARDKAQLDQIAEMYVLSRLRPFAVITWRKPLDDPVREWGQLLAYLPEIEKRLANGSGNAIVLPAPTLGSGSVFDPMETLGKDASDQGISQTEIRRLAVREITDYLEMSGQDPRRFDQLLYRRSRRRR